MFCARSVFGNVRVCSSSRDVLRLALREWRCVNAVAVSATVYSENATTCTMRPQMCTSNDYCICSVCSRSCLHAYFIIIHMYLRICTERAKSLCALIEFVCNRIKCTRNNECRSTHRETHDEISNDNDDKILRQFHD